MAPAEGGGTTAGGTFPTSGRATGAAAAIGGSSVFGAIVADSFTPSSLFGVTTFGSPAGACAGAELPEKKH
jgi:hypothetical protein